MRRINRDHLGRFKENTSWRWVVIGGLVVNFAVGGLMIKLGQIENNKPELLSPYVSSYFVEAARTTPTPAPKDEIERLIYKYFKDDDAQMAIEIMTCESHKNPELIGDKHLITYDKKNNEMVGDSIGLFQVRTGGEGWNRARANKMTAEEFRVWLKKPENNIKYAKDIFDRRGWDAWYNCKNRVLNTRLTNK